MFYLSRDRKVSVRGFCGYYVSFIYRPNDPRGSSKRSAKSFFFIRDSHGTINICRRVNSNIELFRDLFVLLGRNFQYTKTPRESFLVAGDCCLARTPPAHTPHQELASISPAVIACKELQLSASDVPTVGWGLFFVCSCAF